MVNAGGTHEDGWGATESEARRSGRDRPLIVAIDGPAGAGKSTLARRLAAALDLPYVNTGLMYRAVAWLALRQGVDVHDEAGLVGAASELSFRLQGAPAQLEICGISVLSLTSSDVEGVVSVVARHPGVRGILRQVQRELGGDGCVMEGRDIGTVVFPEAEVKLFLSAAPSVRILRRRAERSRERATSEPADLDEPLASGNILDEAVLRRDELDSRTHSLTPAPDAHVIESTTMDPDEVLARALEVVRARGQKRAP